MDIANIDSRVGLLTYLAQMRAELEEGATDCENTDLAAFREAAEAWITDSQQALASNPWQAAAEVLRAGKGYE